jgi:RHS repeat-associated protein
MKAIHRLKDLYLVLLVAVACLCTASPLNAQTLVLHAKPIPILTGVPASAIRPAPARPSVPAAGVQKPQTLRVAAPSCAGGSSQPAPIVALVTALKCDPDLIFEYIYNNIEFEPLYGSNKGPLGTLLDGRGGDADQSVLFTTLLNAAGYTQTQYAWGVVRLTGAQLSSWLGVQNDAAAISTLLTAAGYPTANCTPTANCNGSSVGPLDYIDIGHFDVALELSGTWYLFDPSFKQHQLQTGFSNLAAALGYSRSQFLADVGGTLGSASIAHVNRQALRTDLVNYAGSLVNYINQTDRTLSTGGVIGGKSIEPLTGSPIRQTSFPNLSPAFDYWLGYSGFPADCPQQSPTVACRSYLSLTMPGASSSQSINLYSDEVYGHRITVFSVPSGSEYIPTLLIDGAAPSCVALGTCTNVGSPTPANQTWSVQASYTRPNSPLSDPSCATGVTACKTLTINSGGSYLVSLGVGQVGRGMAEYHRQLLSQARAAGNPDSSELVLGENLATISYAWIAEGSAEQQMTDPLTSTTTLYNFAVGLTAQSTIQETSDPAPYVDLPINDLYIQPQQSNGPTTVVGGISYPTAFVAAGLAYAEASSAFEAAVLQQTQAQVAGITAASTVNIVDDNMNAGYSGALLTTYFADGTTSAGQAYYASTIEPAISSHYNATDLSTITGLVNGGSQVLIPENGQIAVGAWTGGGYTQISPQTSEITITQKISGGMSGGFSGTVIANPAPNTQVNLAPAAASGTLTPLLDPEPAPTNPQIAEPIDGVTGAYLYHHTDITTGSGDFPYALSLSRTYASSAGTALTTTIADQGIGNGWAHTFLSSAQPNSDPYVGMGQSDSPAVSSATSIAALYVMQDLLGQTPTAQTMTVSSMVARWFADQLTGNVVLVQRPGTVEEFVAVPHPDGSTSVPYTPPPGSSVRLSQTATGQYSYLRKEGVFLSYGPADAGALQGMVFPYGMSVDLTYSSGQLIKVANNLGRTLSFSYGGGGSDVSVVTDDTGRSVNYIYDGKHNLVAFTDATGATTSFSYDISGNYDLWGHLTQVFYPSSPENPFITNWYDPLGRVIEQANANGYTANFYFAGSRSEFVDPLGNRHATYQTDRGKVIKDAFVLSSSFGDVFNDTPQQNGVLNVTSNQYDGLDRLTLTTLPEGGTTGYAYATAVNPWANNIATVTRTAKPGSPLSPLTTTFSYDPFYNKVTTVTDPLSLVATLGYDSATGDLLSAVADAGAAPHFGAAVRFSYDRYGRVRTATDPNNVVTAFSYDTFENLVQQVADSGSGHLNATTQFSYNSLGDVTTLTDPNNHTTTFGYDADRRLITATAPAPFSGGAAEVQLTNAYDSVGQLLGITRSNGPSPAVTRLSYTPTGQVASVIDPNGHVTTNAYDADDRLLSVTDPLYRVTSYGYDPMSRLASISNAAIQSSPLAQFAYTPDGLIASLTDGNANATSFTPDGFDRLSTTTYPDSSTENYAYDSDGNVLTRQTRAAATISFSYDTLNRLITKTAPSEPTVTYAYDLRNNLITASDNSAAITAPSGPAVSYATTISYDQLNRPLAVNWSPAPSQTTPTATSAAFGFAYDATNRRVGQTATDSSWWFYPPSASTTAYTANNLNQYTAVGSISPTYDGNGDLTSDGTFSYSYDAESRLTSASGSGLSASYAYDAQGRRKSKTVNGVTTIFVTDADNREVLEYNGSSGAIGNWYAYALGSNDVLNQMNVAAGTRATFIPDIQGSITGSLDASSGSLTKTGYLPYGASATASGSFGFTAQRIDPETNGLYYYRTRIYAPSWGRFMQVDPIRYRGGPNLYAYVANDPLNLNDPLGLAPDSPISASSGIAAAAGGNGGGGGAQGPPSPLAAGGGNGLDCPPFCLSPATGTLRFSQITASPWFNPEGNFAGQTISNVAYQLRSGSLSPSDVPVQVVQNRLIVNTRSSLALMQAGIPQSEWRLIDMTGNVALEAEISARLLRNGLGPAGTDVIRITGSGSNLSTLVGAGTIPYRGP